MHKTVALVDYGVGNLQSVRWALEAVGAEVIQTADHNKIMSADCLVLPGVGAFGHCMKKLNDYGLPDILKAYSTSGRPMLGICVGMQMLMDSSEEFGFHEGLGIIPGSVKKIPSCSLDGVVQKVPCVGWSPIYHRLRGGCLEKPLDKIVEGSHFYFVHSYSVIPKKQENILAKTNYGNREIVAVIRSGNVFGVQFHPEKSASNGLLLMESFLELCK